MSRRRSGVQLSTTCSERLNVGQKQKQHGPANSGFWTSSTRPRERRGSTTCVNGDGKGAGSGAATELSSKGGVHSQLQVGHPGVRERQRRGERVTWGVYVVNANVCKTDAWPLPIRHSRLARGKSSVVRANQRRWICKGVYRGPMTGRHGRTACNGNEAGKQLEWEAELETKAKAEPAQLPREKVAKCLGQGLYEGRTGKRPAWVRDFDVKVSAKRKCMDTKGGRNFKTTRGLGRTEQRESGTNVRLDRGLITNSGVSQSPVQIIDAGVAGRIFRQKKSQLRNDGLGQNWSRHENATRFRNSGAHRITRAARKGGAVSIK
ncbi:hypothetical protein B0H13DRAFT_1921765 [Mycena leptocephala]|nr:hypothetical protein B0H13DRAFT_1921765 [Mycena leptocephala]